MNLADVDRLAGYSEGFGPIAQALHWLDTLTRAEVVPWTEGQREAARRVLADARRVLFSDLLDAARAVAEGREPAVATVIPNADTTVQGLRTEDGGERVAHENHCVGMFCSRPDLHDDLSRAMDERRGQR